MARSGGVSRRAFLGTGLAAVASLAFGRPTKTAPAGFGQQPFGTSSFGG